MTALVIGVAVLMVTTAFLVWYARYVSRIPTRPLSEETGEMEEALERPADVRPSWEMAEVPEEVDVGAAVPERDYVPPPRLSSSMLSGPTMLSGHGGSWTRPRAGRGWRRPRRRRPPL